MAEFSLEMDHVKITVTFGGAVLCKILTLNQNINLTEDTVFYKFG
jgi:hypothetical protein